MSAIFWLKRWIQIYLNTKSEFEVIVIDDASTDFISENINVKKYTKLSILTGSDVSYLLTGNSYVMFSRDVPAEFDNRHSLRNFY